MEVFFFLWSKVLPGEVAITPTGATADDKWPERRTSPPSRLIAGVKGGSLLFFANAVVLGPITWASVPLAVLVAVLVAVMPLVATVKGPDGGSPIVDIAGVFVAELDETSGT